MNLPLELWVCEIISYLDIISLYNLSKVYQKLNDFDEVKNRLTIPTLENFFLLKTTEYLKPYKNNEQIQFCLDNIKSDMQIQSARVWTNDCGLFLIEYTFDFEKNEYIRVVFLSDTLKIIKTWSHFNYKTYDNCLEWYPKDLNQKKSFIVVSNQKFSSKLDQKYNTEQLKYFINSCWDDFSPFKEKFFESTRLYLMIIKDVYQNRELKFIYTYSFDGDRTGVIFSGSTIDIIGRIYYLNIIIENTEYSEYQSVFDDLTYDLEIYNPNVEFKLKTTRF